MAAPPLGPWYRTALALVLVLFAGEVWAQGISATIDRNEATVRDQLRLTVTIQGSQQVRPQLPELSAFEIYARGQSSQFQIVNGRTTSSVAHNFILVPKRTGTFTIGPVKATIDGRTVASRAFSVRIHDAAAEPQQSRDLFLTATVSTDKPYLGQQVIFTWRWYRRVRAGSPSLEPLQFPGFLEEELGEVREYQTTVKGQQYLVSEIRRALFPQEEGTLTIPSTTLTCQVAVRSRRSRRSVFDDFFSSTTSETKVLRSGPITLEVKPLPPSPVGFSGLVGRFDLRSQVSKRHLKVGESTTLTLTISGTGNVQMITEPSLPGLTRFKAYDDKPGGSVDRTGLALSGVKVFRKALVPLEPGDLSIPGLTLAFFDPDQGAYRTIRTSAIPLTVSPADGQEELRLTESISPSTGKVAVRILADDILPVYKNLDAVVATPFARPGPLLIAGLVLPPLLFFGLILVHRQQRRFELDVGLKRRRVALRTAHRSLAKIRSEAGDDRVLTAQLASRCLRSMIGDKLGIEGSALTPGEVRQHLAEQGVTEKTITETHELLDRFEAAQYGAATVQPDQIASQLKPLFRQLDRQIKTKART